MKKIFYSVALLSAMIFSSCSEDRGTTYEVANANVDEDVNPNQIRGYGDEPSRNTADIQGDADLGYRQEAEQVASRMASDLKLDQQAQTRVQQVLYDRAKRMGDLEDRYNYSETNRMGGQTNNDTENDMASNPNTNQDATRPNNAGNAYTGNSNEGEGTNANAANANQNMAGTSGNNLGNDMTNTGAPLTQTQMESEQKKIMQDTDRQMKEALTPEQYKQWQQNRAKYSNTEMEDVSSKKTSGGATQKKSN